jgi:hypothetical protein
MLRSAGAVAAGILVLTALSFAFEWVALLLSGAGVSFTPQNMSTPLRAIVSVLTLLSVVAGGYVTASLAARNQVAHATSMGAIELLLTVPVVLSMTGERPGWVAIASICLLVPAAWAGGALRVAQLRRATAAAVRPAEAS